MAAGPPPAAPPSRWAVGLAELEQLGDAVQVLHPVDAALPGLCRAPSTGKTRVRDEH